MRSHVVLSPEPVPVSILGVAFDSVTISTTIARIRTMIEERKPRYVATANMDFVVQAQSDVELRRILQRADLVLCDGTPLVWASRLLGNPLPERVAGADLVPELISVAEEHGYRIFLLGATPEACERAVSRLSKTHPALQIAGHYSPPFKPLLKMDHDEIARRVKEARPDILLVAFGCPKQEKWIAMHYRSLGVPVSIGVGATIDFLGGCMKRAPKWMQRSGTEWVFRLLQEPRRLFRRYALDIGVFGTRFLGQLRRMRKSVGQKPGQTCSAMLRTNEWQHLTLPRRFDVDSARLSVPLIQDVLTDRRHCLLELGEVEELDSTGVAVLLHLQKQLTEQGRFLVLVSPRQAVMDLLRFMRVQDSFAIAPNLEAARRLKESRTTELAVPVVGLNPVFWQGNVTASNANEVLRETTARLNGERVVQIDLSRVRYLDSTGAAAMGRLVESSRAAGRDVVFSGASESVRNVLRFARLEHVLASTTEAESARGTRKLIPAHQHPAA